MAAAEGDERRDLFSCLAAAVPEVAFCPNGTTFSPDATIPEIGVCRHECTSNDAWNPEHVCYPMVSTGTFDSSNNTCGIGNCDSHTNRSACESGEGHWDIDRNFVSRTDQSCSHVKAETRLLAYVQPDSAVTRAAQAVGKVGEFCCDGFDAEAFMQCTSDDAPIFVRPKDACTSKDVLPKRMCTAPVRPAA